MAKCEEHSCINVQSAICLHCDRRLCALHVVNHGAILLEEANELSDQLNEVAEHLSVYLQQIQTKHNDAIQDIDIWRQRILNKIQNICVEKKQAIKVKQNSFIELENKLSQRLTKDVREPLERMQVQKSANYQVLQVMRQALNDIKEESKQLQWTSTESANQFSSFNIQNTTMVKSKKTKSDDQHSYESNSSRVDVQNHAPIYSLTNQWFSTYPSNQPSSGQPSPVVYIDPKQNLFSNMAYLPVNSSGFIPVVRHPSEHNQSGTLPLSHRPQLTTATSTLPYQLGFPQTIISIAPPINPSQPMSTDSSRLPLDINRLPAYASRKLINLFMNVSDSNEYLLRNFIIKNLSRAAHGNNMMVLILSFLESWHSKLSPTIVNERILSYHIFTIKTYMNCPDHEYIAIAAILRYITNCNYNEIKSGQLMIILLQHFFEHKCITKTTILDWYENGATYGYRNFHEGKQWAKPFVDKLNSDVYMQ
ncbi:unnamed protein product [Adineta steineri]|uniref:Uncharacterized protein n=1 Tax=Adineta steineri TaxID=433720 RepID=A0A813VF67_9BILA|nr:unnamed protein product [Adineta steineri]CAF3768623.1 unnamed protein product [Adineta steineri]